MLLNILQVLLLLFVPALVLWLEKRIKLIKIISPVLTCYLVGIAMANQSAAPVNLEISMIMRNATVAMAIPLLLFSVDIMGWLRLSRPTVISFALCMVSVMIMSTVGHLIFHNHFAESAKISGMLVGVYTGGTPNMNAIGTALKINSEMFILLESVDMLLGALYLVFLLTLGPRLLKRILPPFPHKDNSAACEELAHKAEIVFRHVILAVLLTLAVVGVAGGLSLLVPESLLVPVIILLITSLAIVCSLNRKVRALKGSHEAGMYVLLIFCVAVGSSAKIENLMATPPELLAFIALVMFGAVALHIILAVIFRIDRDTMIITSAAGIYGPPFIAPVAAVLKNREVLVSGIATGLVGYAVGNYLGLGLAWLLGG